MKRLILLPVFASILCSAFAADVIYSPQTAPADLASTPAPKDDWYATVQGKFTKYGNKHADIVFDGDSITNRWETTGREQWTQYAGRAADFGIEGDRTENLLWRLSKGQVDGVDPKLIVIMIGTNNSGRDSAEVIASGVKAIVAEYRKRCPDAHIVLMAIFPRGKQANDGGRQKVLAVDEIIKSLDDGTHVSYVDIGPKLVEADGSISLDMMPDSVHPTAKGYVIWANAIQPFVDKYAPAKN